MRNHVGMSRGINIKKLRMSTKENVGKFVRIKIKQRYIWLLANDINKIISKVRKFTMCVRINNKERKFIDC